MLKHYQLYSSAENAPRKIASTNRVPIYSILASTTSVNEGSSVTFTVNTENVPEGTILYWTTNTVSGTVNTRDFNDSTRSGSVVISGTFAKSTATIIRTISSDLKLESTESFQIQIRTGSRSGTIVATSEVVTINDVTYSVSPSTTSVNEGSGVTFTVTTTNIANGTTLYWTTNTVSGTINTSDFTDSVTSGSFTITGNVGSFTRTLSNDITTEGSESFQIQIRTGSTSGTIVATSSTITINDTSLSPTYSVSPSTTSVNEGSSVTFTVTTTNVSDGTTLYWSTNTVSGTVNTSDFSDSVTSGSFTISANTGTITRTLTSDSTTEGSESFQIQIRTGSTSGTVVATSSTVIINDTSVPALYSFTSATFTPGGQTGRYGPSLSQAISGLTGTGVDNWKNNTNFFNVSNGVQLWKPPTTGLYRIELVGARGGSSIGVAPGYGARIIIDATLLSDQFYSIVIGQEGASGGGGSGGHGGGGTFLYSGNFRTGTLIAAAGGGGGTGHDIGFGGNGSSTTNSTSGGGRGTGGNYGIGLGGRSFSNDGGQGSWNGAAGGGIGWGSDGELGGFSGYTNRGTGGQLSNNSPIGGARNDTTSASESGGFGGGGGGGGNGLSGGGGGGYTGGGGGANWPGTGNPGHGGGGGGGSYNAPSTTLVSSTAGFRNGVGYMTIQKI